MNNQCDACKKRRDCTSRCFPKKDYDRGMRKKHKKGENVMAERILTLCDKCAEEIRGGLRVKPVAGRTTTERKKKCENCGASMGGMCKQYIVSGKGH